MEFQDDLYDLLCEMQQQNRKQLRATRFICLFCALLTVGALAVGFVAATTVTKVTKQVAPVLEMADQAEEMLDSLKDVAGSMSNVDLGSVMKDMSKLTQESQAGIMDAMAKLEAIDFEGLSNAIDNLANAVESMPTVPYNFG